MGVAHGSFTPTFAFTKVAKVFALFAESQGDTGGTVDEAKLRDYYTSSVVPESRRIPARCWGFSRGATRI